MAISTRAKTRLVIFAGCDACGQVHAVTFKDEHDFVQLVCPVEQVPLYRTAKAAREVFSRVQKDLTSGAIAA
jgi:hypothetical protein